MSRPGGASLPMLITLTLMALAPYAGADLPVHCIRSWVILGDWELEFSRAGTNSDARTCGYPQPDSNKHHFDHPEAYAFDVDSTFKVRLSAPNIVECVQGCGTLGRKNKAKPSRQLQQLHRFQATRDLFNAIDDLPLSAGWQARGRRQRTRVRALDPANPEKLADYFGSDRGALHPHRRFQNLTLGLQDETSEMGDQAGTAATSRVSFSATTGTFTMVYDEGIEIRLGNRRIFAFFEYRPKQGFDYHKGDELEHYETDCGRLRTGWSHVYEDTGGTPAPGWACVSGRKITDSPGGYAAAPVEATELDSEGPVVSPTSFIVRAEKIDPDSLFRHNHSFIAEHNSNPMSTWKAHAYSRFARRKVSEMHQLLGGSGRHRLRVAHKRQRARQLAATEKINHKLRKSRLPRAFDWRDRGIETPVANQGACGSCYAVAAMDVATMRLMINQQARKNQNINKISLSAHDALDKSFYNQGCAGGYPYLIGKHGADFGFIESACLDDTFRFSTTESRDSRNRRDSRNHDCSRRVQVQEYRYLGGYYGNCSELTMLEEIYEKGPIVAAFNAPSNLFSYQSGVFTGGRAAKNDNWEKTNHAIVVVGWGTGPQGDYWVTKNSWGSFWGENGYFKMKRGTDDCAFESMGVAIDLAVL